MRARRWYRPYSLDLVTMSATAGTVMAVVGGGALTAVVFSGDATAIPPLVLCAVAAVIWARRAMVGVYVSDFGIKSRSMMRTVTTDWASVLDIHSREATLAGLDLGRDGIYIDLRSGPAIQTPVQRGRFQLFGSRAAVTGVITWPEHYAEILETLRDRLAESRPAERPDREEPPVVVVVRKTVGRPPWHQKRAALDNELQVLQRKLTRREITDDEFQTMRADLMARGGGL